MNQQSTSRGRMIGSMLAFVANLFTSITFIIQTKFQWNLIIINPFFWLTVLITATYGLLMGYYKIVDYKKSFENRLKYQEDEAKILLKEQENKFILLLQEKDTRIDLLRKNVNENLKIVFDNFTTSFNRHNELVWKIEAEKESKDILQKSELAKYSADVQRLIKLYEPKGMGIELRSRS